jgi:predicted amidophosphoribosyltransferase
MAQAGRAALRIALDAVLPPLCASCRAPLADAGGLCPACWARMSFLAPPWCERLGIPFGHDPGPGVLSMEAIADPPAYGRARAAVRYDDVARDLVHRLKYGDRLDLATAMGRWMARAGRELLDDADALVPVPLHWRRLWGRRFNQAAALARAAAARRASRYSPRPSSAGAPPPSRSACRAARGLSTSRARLPSPRKAGPQSATSGSFSSTMS